MSRAFTKEDDGDQSEDLPPRPVSSFKNYVTPAGKKFLVDRVTALGARRSELAKTRHEPETVRKLKEVERDLRYYEIRAESAILIDHSEKSPEEALFGAEVAVAVGGEKTLYRIVGEDEADVKVGKICWASPLADLLLGKKAGETVVWERPDGKVELRILAVRYPKTEAS